MSNNNFFDNISSLEELKTSNVSFEVALQKLEEIVSMNSSDISLEKSIKNFKLAKILSAYCQEILNQAKLEIEDIKE